MKSTFINQKTVKEKKSHLKWSIYFLTFNTNQIYDADNPDKVALKKRTKEAIKYIIDPNHIREFVKFNREGHEWNEQFIRFDKSELQGVFEIGKRTQQIHGHMLIKIGHHSNIHLDYEGIKAKIKEITGLPSIHFDRQRITSPLERFEDILTSYMEKQYRLEAKK